MILINAEQFRNAQLMLASVPNGVNKAIAAALNRATKGAKTEAVKAAKDKYYIRATDVRETITITKSATENERRVVLKARGTRRPLIQFKVSPNSIRTDNPPAILKVAVKRGSGLKGLPQAFVQKGRSTGRLHVLQRQSPSRYPIFIKYGPSVPEMLETDNVRNHIENEARRRLDDSLNHEINRLLRGIGR
jgi:hypothetical protein